MVSSNPVPFTALPRTIGDDQAETPAVHAKYATALDANFAAVNAWASVFESTYYRVAKVSNANLVVLNEPDWFAYEWATQPPGDDNQPTTYADGLLLGEVRFLSLGARWQGFTEVMADAYGGIADQKIGTLVDKRFWPGGGQQICFTGSWGDDDPNYEGGTATFYIYLDGTIWVAGLSEKWGSLSTDNALTMSVAYIPAESS